MTKTILSLDFVWLEIFIALRKKSSNNFHKTRSLGLLRAFVIILTVAIFVKNSFHPEPNVDPAKKKKKKKICGFRLSVIIVMIVSKLEHQIYFENRNQTNMLPFSGKSFSTANSLFIRENILQFLKFLIDGSDHFAENHRLSVF